MNRCSQRGGLALLAAFSILATPFASHAQRTAPPPRVAVVLSSGSSLSAVRLAAFQEGLKELGYADGRNVVIESHSWFGAARPLADLAAELVRLNPAVIVAEGNMAMFALKHATTTIPIVMAVVGDPVGSGFVAKLARPGANITGLSNTAEQLSGKRLELLKELVPSLTRVAVLRNPTNPTHANLLRETEAEAPSLGMALVPFDFTGEGDLDGAFAAMARDRAQAVLVLPQPIGLVLRRQLVELAARHRLPAMFPWPEAVEVGGLVSYGPSPTLLWHRTGSYVDRILKGARPTDLPIEQPTRFDLVLNLKTARALGLTVPRSLLLRVTQTIE